MGSQIFNFFLQNAIKPCKNPHSYFRIRFGGKFIDCRGQTCKGHGKGERLVGIFDTVKICVHGMRE